MLISLKTEHYMVCRGGDLEAKQLKSTFQPSAAWKYIARSSGGAGWGGSF